MIALVAGEVAVRRPDHVVVETAGGVGYRLAVSAETLRHVPAVGGTVSLHAHLVVRDDALQLYGFATEEERDLFLLLLGVQSVGPKVALAVPRRRHAARARRARSPPATSRACRPCPGIGKRTAERIVVELREKVGVVPDAGDAPITVAAAATTRARSRARACSSSASRPPRPQALLDGADGETAEELHRRARCKAARG